MRDFRIRQWQDVKVVECVPIREAGFVAAFSTRCGGVSALPAGDLNLGYFAKDDPANVSENRRRFLTALGLEGYKIATVKQIHSSMVYVVDDLNAIAGVSCDALLTRLEKVLLGILTADCLPILIVDTVRNVCAGAHAGWRGTLARIAEQTVTAMQKTYGTYPEDCLVAMGPAIGICCFEVGPEVRESFEREFSYAESLFCNPRADGKSHMNLRQANIAQLEAMGISRDKIYVWAECTLCNTTKYFSYRAEARRGAVGRLLSVVGKL
ncbi:MAG: peptidoglycan editing factor PgeF [Acidobacteriota bacterium]|nr:peptidoglycan editing factor PgeF [Blastocatellia bacterium]MDW8411246.1 peptidoglycan editing factor PgeF [Acidobacteriota bacterium]